MRTILIVGGGYAGFYPAWRLEKKPRRGEARVIVVDPLAFDQAAGLPPGPERRRLLSVTFFGGGFFGVEGFGELLSLAKALIRRYPELSPDELSFHLVEARGRILPEVTDRPGEWVVRSLTKRGARVHLNTWLLSARDGHLVMAGDAPRS